MWQLLVTGLEHKEWTAEVGPDINDPPASGYSMVKSDVGLSLVVTSIPPYGGWLAKHVEPLLVPARYIRFHFQMMIDVATLAAAQVAEVDSKFTDVAGWTYDCSAQFNIAKDWMFQVDDPWKDTGIQIEPLRPYEWTSFTIDYVIDYEGHTSSVVALTVGEEFYAVAESLWNIPAVQAGWSPDDGIVTQLQQVTNHLPNGGYTLLFRDVGYVLDMWTEKRLTLKP